MSTSHRFKLGPNDVVAGDRIQEYIPSDNEDDSHANVSSYEEAFKIQKEQEILLRPYEKRTTKTEGKRSSEFGVPVDLSSLPWSASERDIRGFLSDDVEVLKVLIVLNDNRKPSGEARVWVASEDDVTRALIKNNSLLGQRKVRVR